MWVTRRARNSTGSTVAVPAAGPIGLVGTVGHLLRRGIVAHPLQRNRISGAIAGQAQSEGAIVFGHPHTGMNVKARVGPLEHPLGLVFVEEAPADEEPEDRAAERLG